MESVQGPQGHDDGWLTSRFRFPKAIILTSKHRSGMKGMVKCSINKMFRDTRLIGLTYLVLIATSFPNFYWNVI